MDTTRAQPEALAGRLHRDEAGAAMIDYVLVAAVLFPMAYVVLRYLMLWVGDYFGMIAYYVSWPFF